MSDMDIRQHARLRETILFPLDYGTRGAIIGKVAEALAASAARCHLSFEGRYRHARLLLARDLLHREVLSFNELSDGEMIAISSWVQDTAREEVLDRWLEKTFGKQLTLTLE